MSNSTALKDYYKKYCKIFTRIIHSAKRKKKKERKKFHSQLIKSKQLGMLLDP
jgi:hypothetical protein